jgi:hypothetical protein
MEPEASFIAFIPLSNWLRGFDRYGMRYSKARITESTYRDAFYLLREDESWAPGLGKVRKLVAKLGLGGDRVVALRARLPSEAVKQNDVTGTDIGWRWPSPEVPLSGVAWVDDGGQLVPTRHEDVTAHAFQLHDATLARWDECRPRSFSVLPVARACQASCAFCFSKASVSDLERQQSASLEHVLAWADEAVRRGAERAVVTGGGEPTLLAREKLLALTRGLSERFSKTLLISNGARLDAPFINDLRHHGLTTLALSRHGLDAEHDARVMGLSVNSAEVARSGVKAGLRVRAICVLQRQGVATVEDVRAYVQRSVREGFHEVCFKELYVSSLSENPWAPSVVNRFCEENQVPLAVVLEAMKSLGFVKRDELPWGSPVFEGEVEGRRVKVAAYTEPSVGWERANRFVRSWNVMADGSCLASLEDPKSRVAHAFASSPRPSPPQEERE